MSFKNLSVSKKLISVFAIVLMATLGLGLFAIQRLEEVTAHAQAVKTNWLPSVAALGELRYYTARMRQKQACYLLEASDAGRAKETKLVNTLTVQANQVLRNYPALVNSDQERALFEKFASLWRQYESQDATIKQLALTQGQAAGFSYYNHEALNVFNTFTAAVDKAMKMNSEGGAHETDAGDLASASARLWIYVVMGLAALLCAVGGFVLIGAVSKPLGNMTDAMGELAKGRLDAHVPHADQHDEIGKLAAAMTAFKDQLAKAERSKEEQTQAIVSSIGAGLDYLARGDLTHRVTAELTGAFAKLKGDFNAAMDHLQGTIKNVLNSTRQIASNAGETSTAADDLSRRTEQQAASLEETAAALEEITATVKKTAANAKEASRSVADAKGAAEDGGRVVETAIKAMDAIAQSSKQITDIIGVIDEIAFQTNLLALNAGVEAARAGEAGKGFAVVASEVRSLAQRSSEAAKEIKTLINTSGEYVANGVKYVGESGQALQRIVDQVLRINALVSEMAGAAEQQSSGIEQVNAAVNQMDQVTQKNAAMVEEATAASRNMAEETKTLNDLIGFFCVGETGFVEAARPKAERHRAAPVPSRRPAVKLAAAGGARPVPLGEEDWTDF